MRRTLTRLAVLPGAFSPGLCAAAGAAPVGFGQAAQVLLGLLLLYLGIAGAQGYVQAHYGLYLPLSAPSSYEWRLLGAILAAALLMGCVPAWRAYRQSLADGLSIRL